MKRHFTSHRRWPNGYPTGLVVGGREAMTEPGGFARAASSMTKANHRFAYLGLKPPRFGRERD